MVMIFLVILLFILGLIIGMLVGFNLAVQTKVETPSSAYAKEPYSRMQDTSDSMYYSNGVHKHNPMLDR